MKLIVGLGNPGKQYERTRHNVGFSVVDRLAHRNGLILNQRRDEALIAEWSVDGQRVVLAKPQTFMNRSGTAVRDLLDEYHGSPDDLIVVYDDLDLPLGRIRLRGQGSAGGHRGILSILEHLAGAAFFRVRVGIGRPPEGADAADFVLSPFDDQESGDAERAVEHAAEAVESLLKDGPRRAMELYNRAS
ncbi:MAG: aminoacyl-tRNA hydrolase [Candidatus Binatia bacterium]